MQRTNLILLLVFTICALGLVTSQHKVRRLVAGYEQEVARTRALETEFQQLTAEASTYSKPSTVENYATNRLQMRPVDPKRTQLVTVEPPRRERPDPFERSLAAVSGDIR